MAWFEQKKPADDVGELARLGGFKSGQDFLYAAALGGRESLCPANFRSYYETLCATYGKRATDAAGAMIIAGTFEGRFGGGTLDAAMDELSLEYADSIEDILNEMRPTDRP